MARLKRLFFGGILGAGLALVVSRKEVRKALMGVSRKALPAAGTGSQEPHGAGSSSAWQPPEPEPAPGDFEARIADTRRQVEQHIQSFTPLQESPPSIEEPETFPAVAAERAEAEQLIPGEEPVSETEAEIGLEGEGGLEEIAPVEEFLPAEPEVAAEGESQVEQAPEPEAFVVAEEPAAEIVEPESASPAESDRPSLEAELTISGEPEPEESEAPAPSGIDREEMRRRIDETRARLKAKAFDAMISGETFIDETSAEKAGHGEEDTLVDKETEDRIDESLKEQD